MHALHLQEPVPLTLVPEFDGAGVYALYCHGKFPAYKALAAINVEKLIEPIYIGKASPSGARKGIELATQTTVLTKRLKDHKKSIEAATSLNIEDFSTRWLVMEDVWIALGESAMIRRFVSMISATMRLAAVALRAQGLSGTRYIPEGRGLRPFPRH